MIIKRNEEKFYEYQKNGFTISTNPDLLDIDVIHDFVTKSYWARGIPKELVIKSIRHSFCFGLYDQGIQIGFARLISDYTTEAKLCEIFIVEPYQGRGLGKWLIESVISCPKLQGIRTLSLGTRDGHEFYKKVGFHVVGECPNRMQILYKRPWYIREKKESE
jgi:N-acetylglutamate synthase-like GNAT family acetyltransferase